MKANLSLERKREPELGKYVIGELEHEQRGEKDVNRTLRPPTKRYVTATERVLGNELGRLRLVEYDKGDDSKQRRG